MNKSVDIIIPIYNTEPALLEKCLSSAVSQNCVNKIILIDDGSTNEWTRKVIRSYARTKRYNICLYRQNNAGVSSARNKGLFLSDGDYIYYLDADDYLESGHIEHLVKVANKNRMDIVFAGKVKEDTGWNDAPFVKHKISLKNDADVICIKSPAFTSQGVLIEGNIARSIRFREDMRLGEDTEYMVRAMKKGVCYFDGCGGYVYRKNANSATADRSMGAIGVFLDDALTLRELLKKEIAVDNKTLNIFIYLKAIRAYDKSCSANGYKKTKKLVRSYFRANDISRLKAKEVIKNRLLSKGEKIRIIAMNNRLYFLLFCYNKLKAWGGKNEKDN